MDSVLNEYIDSPVWKIRESGDTAYVDISGKITGTDADLIVTIGVAKNLNNPDSASIFLESVTLDGDRSPTQNDAVEFLLAMFFAYDEGYDNLADIYLDNTSTDHSQSTVYIDGSQIEVTGTVIKEQQIHAGNGSLLSGYIFILDNPVEIDFGEGEYLTESEIHLFADDLEDYVGQTINVRGTIMEAHTAYHFRPICLLDTFVVDQQNGSNDLNLGITEDMAKQLLEEWLAENPLVDGVHTE